jgi:hypothetical protein
MSKSKLIGNFHLYAKKQSNGYKPFIGNIKTGKNFGFDKILKTPEECVVFLRKHLEEIKKEHF